MTERALNILVCDPLAEEGLEILRRAGDVRETPGLSEAELCAAVSDVDALIVRSQTRVTAAVIEAASRLRVIARAGVGVDNVDVEAATRRGIYVVNSPGGNTTAAAEHTIAMLMAAARSIPQANAELKAGRWTRAGFTGHQITGKTLGVLGLGRVGGEVAKRAVALGMRVLACDPYIGAERAATLGAALVSLDELLSQAHFVAVCAKLTPETTGAIGAPELALMRPDAVLVNCARGGIVDEAALLAALQGHRIAAAALDVFAEEPGGNPDLIALPNVVATPHLGASTEEAQVTVAVEAAEQVAEVLAGRLPRWPVNVPRLTDETASALEPHFRLTDGLAALLTVLAEETPARVELRCEGDLPGGDPTPLMRRLLVSVLAERVAGEVNVVNAPTVARECGIATEQALVAPSRGYAHLVEASVTAGDCCHTVAGALLEHGEPRIVEIAGYTCDLPLTGEALLVWNAEPDKPGFVGRLGTLLGEAGVSIKAVNIAPETIGGQGLLIVSTEARAGELVREQVSGLAGLADIRGVSFGA